MNTSPYIYTNKDGRQVELKRAYKPLNEFGKELVELKSQLEAKKERKINNSISRKNISI